MVLAVRHTAREQCVGHDHRRVRTNGEFSAHVESRIPERNDWIGQVFENASSMGRQVDQLRRVIPLHAIELRSRLRGHMHGRARCAGHVDTCPITLHGAAVRQYVDEGHVGSAGIQVQRPKYLQGELLEMMGEAGRAGDRRERELQQSNLSRAPC
jgi:hypothetical protein